VNRRLPRLPARWLPRALAAVVAATALLVGGASAAQAHNILVGTSPKNGSMTGAVPASVTLTFNEPALAVGTILIVTGPAGQVQTGATILVNNTVSQHLRPGSPAGRYTVVWRVTSSDGHPVSGQFVFTAMSASPGQAPAASSAATSSHRGAQTPATTGGQAFTLWWVVALAVVALVLLAALVQTRKPRTTPADERDQG